MKVVKMVFVLVLLFAGTAFAADVTPELWQADYALYQNYMSANPKDYLGAVNITRKWVDFSSANPDQVKKASGNESLTKEALQGILNNIYREVSQVLVQDYSSLMKTDALKAAGLAINVQKFFNENPALLEEFASANNSNTEAMKGTLQQAIKAGILETYRACAQEYSRLNQEKKFDEAAKLSANWAIVVSDWEAHNSPLPKEFETFANVKPEQTVADLQSFEKDYSAWREATEKGDFKTAFDLVDKWIAFEKAHPEQAIAVGYMYSARDGGKADDKTDWKNSFRVATYAKMWNFEVVAYQKAMAEGRSKDAIELIKKWEGLFGGEFGKGIAKELGMDVDVALKTLAAERAKLEAMDPKIASENVDSFKKDLAEYNKLAETFNTGAPAGSDAWYNSAAGAAELCGKWSKIAKDNPALAEEIKKATGIELPKAANDAIGYILDKTVADSAQKLNSSLGSGDIAGALKLVKSWKDYLDKQPVVKEITTQKWGASFINSLRQYKRGLEIMAGEARNLRKPLPPTSVPETTETTPSPSPTEAPADTNPGTLGTSGN
ncbi:MAG: hypothetical protein WA705_29315 [Candidatus Ozemobacteraceae bacterium]